MKRAIMPRLNQTIAERFERHFHPEPNTGCWLWTGHLHDHGYAMLRANGKNMRMHRWSYEHFIGPIPRGLQIDHLCRTRCCVNPDHLEAVTGKENTKRGLSGSLARARNLAKTHCPRGHAYTPENIEMYRDGKRRCRTCIRARRRKNQPLAPGEASAPTQTMMKGGFLGRAGRGELIGRAA